MPAWLPAFLSILGKLAGLLPYLGAWLAGRQAVRKDQAEEALDDVAKAAVARNAVRGLDAGAVRDRLRQWQRD